MVNDEAEKIFREFLIEPIFQESKASDCISLPYYALGKELRRMMGIIKWQN